MCLGGRNFAGRDLLRNSAQAPGIYWQLEGGITTHSLKWQHRVLIFHISVSGDRDAAMSEDWCLEDVCVCVCWMRGMFFTEDDSRRAVINRVQSATTNCTDTLIGQSMNSWVNQSRVSIQQYVKVQLRISKDLAALVALLQVFILTEKKP